MPGPVLYTERGRWNAIPALISPGAAPDAHHEGPFRLLVDGRPRIPPTTNTSKYG